MRICLYVFSAFILASCNQSPIFLIRNKVEITETNHWQEPKGIVDTTFGNNGRLYIATGSQSAGKTLTRDSNGSFWISGNWAQDFSLFKITPLGALDTSFSQGGRYSYSFPIPTGDLGKGSALFSDGSQLLYGYTKSDTGTELDFGFVKLFPDGTRDFAFGGSGTVKTDIISDSRDTIRTVVPNSNGSFFALGNSYDGSTYWSVVSKYTSNGQLDPTFLGSGKAVFNNSAVEGFESGVILDNGDLMAVGYMSYELYLRKIPVNGFAPNFTILPNADGGTVPYKVIRDGKGRLLIGGLRKFGEKWFILRTNENAELDTSFGIDGAITFDSALSSSYASVYDLSVQPDGKILVAGYMEGRAGAADFVLLRLEENGTLDTSFGNNGMLKVDYDGGVDTLTSMHVTSTGAIYLLGNSRKGVTNGILLVMVK